MDSEPNTCKHGRVMTAGVYIAVPCLKIQQCAEMETELTSHFNPHSLHLHRGKGEIIPFNYIRLY